MINKMNEKKLADWKKTLAGSGVTYETDDEYKEAFSNLVGFFDILIQMDLQQKRAKEQKSTNSQ